MFTAAAFQPSLTKLSLSRDCLARVLANNCRLVKMMAEIVKESREHPIFAKILNSELTIKVGTSQLQHYLRSHQRGDLTNLFAALVNSDNCIIPGKFIDRFSLLGECYQSAPDFLRFQTAVGCLKQVIDALCC